jgi:hypothetical protein
MVIGWMSTEGRASAPVPFKLSIILVSEIESKQSNGIASCTSEAMAERNPSISRLKGDKSILTVANAKRRLIARYEGVTLYHPNNCNQSSLKGRSP